MFESANRNHKGPCGNLIASIFGFIMGFALNICFIPGMAVLATCAIIGLIITGIKRLFDLVKSYTPSGREEAKRRRL